MIERDLSASVGQRRPADAYARLLLVIGAWALLIGGLQLYAWQHMLSLLDLLQSLVNICRTSPFGPLLFIGAAMLSPLLLIPAALLGSVAGLCFGPIFGVFYTIIGCNLSATLTYSLGRISGGKLEGSGRFGRLIARYGPQLRNTSLLGVIMLRLSFLPYDPINYLIGVMQVRWVRFMVGNTVGSLPGVIAIVLAGTSIEGFENGLPMLKPAVLISSILLLFLSLVLALVLKQRADGSA